MGTINRAVMAMAAVMGLGKSAAMAAASKDAPVKTGTSDGRRRYRHNYRYGGNKSGKYLGHPKFGGEQEIARRAQKIREGKGNVH